MAELEAGPFWVAAITSAIGPRDILPFRERTALRSAGRASHAAQSSNGSATEPVRPDRLPERPDTPSATPRGRRSPATTTSTVGGLREDVGRGARRRTRRCTRLDAGERAAHWARRASCCKGQKSGRTGTSRVNHARRSSRPLPRPRNHAPAVARSRLLSDRRSAMGRSAMRRGATGSGSA